MLAHELSKLLPKIVGRDDDFLLRSFSLRTKVTFFAKDNHRFVRVGYQSFSRLECESNS